MSRYNLLAKSDKPTLFLESSSTVDQSGNAYSLSSNNLQTTGQPIIYENPASFDIDETHGVNIDNNPALFVNNRIIEFVAKFFETDVESKLLVDENDNGLYFDNDSINLKFGDGADLTSQLSITVADWSIKHYVRVEFYNDVVNLVVDEEHSSLPFTLTPSTNAISLVTDNSARVLLDGFGIYAGKVSNRSIILDDPNTGHSRYANEVLAGLETRFQTYDRIEHTYTKSEFLYDENYIVNYVNYQIPVSAKHHDLILRTNSKQEIKYSIDNADPLSFFEEILLDVTAVTSISLVVEGIQLDDDFYIQTVFIRDRDIYSQSPAVMTLSAPSIFYSNKDSAMVNLPRGMLLNEESISATSLVDKQSIELIVKTPVPTEETFIYKDDDCSISYGPGSIDNATVYLNGILVVNLNTIKTGQLNHLVIIPDSHTNQDFLLNTDGATTAIVEYVSLSIYPTELDAAQALALYELASSKNALSVVEDAVSFSEVDFDGENANVYSFSWAIVSSGGQ